MELTCVLSGLSREAEPIGIYVERETDLSGTGSCDYGVWQVPRSTEQISYLEIQETTLSFSPKLGEWKIRKH